PGLEDAATHGLVYCGGTTWTLRHLDWIRRQRLDQPPSQLALDEYYDTVLTNKARRDRLDAAIEAMAADSEFTPITRRLGCLRGIGTLTGFALAVEIGDWHRFTGNSIGSFVGPVPSEESSGATRSQGSITKTGNKHVRRLLVEAAWHHRNPYRPGTVMRRRWNQATPAVRARGDLGNRRLPKRWRAFDARQKKSTIANTAIARELASWCWSLAIMDDD
ncbi:MAG: transposase, partial [Propioniciclava sp.]